MYSFSAETIFNAFKNLTGADNKIGGLFCILKNIGKDIKSSAVYQIPVDKVKASLNEVFDFDKASYEKNDSWFIVFSKNWEKRFFDSVVKQKIDLLSCAVFFLRRCSFEDEISNDEIIELFLENFNLKNYKDLFFVNNNQLNIEYTKTDNELNQKEFYNKCKFDLTKKAFKFNFESVAASSTEFSRGAQIQPLYSGKDTQTCFLIGSINWSNCYDFSSRCETLSANSIISENEQIATPHTSPIQKIFYGVPGCGKSHKISEMLEDKNIFDITSEENQIVRTVFHPDYTNADFVGQILPEVKGEKIEYNFKAGPFTEILAKALINPENQYVLIIEEINRGNSAAIFGEIFQLLDRLEGEKTSTIGGNKYGKGWSEYFFMNDLINEYVRKIASPSDNVETSVQINGITFTENTGIRLPPNLSLLATMNTSDQNVFTLDNAFQRRWDMEYISNKYEESKANDKQKAQYNSKIGETAISWGKFRDAINKEISNPENSFANAEDKQLGLFFIKAENNVINESDFSNKVLKYLWNDIFKRDKSIFNDDVSTFGDLLDAFKGADAFANSFSSDFVSKIAE